MTDDARSASPDDDRAGSRRVREPLLVALVGLAAAVLLFLASLIPVLRDRGAGDGDPATTLAAPGSSSTTDTAAVTTVLPTAEPPATITSAPAVPTTTTTTTVVSTTTTSPATTTTAPEVSTTTTSPATTTTAPEVPTTRTVTIGPLTPLETDEVVPESRAVVRDGQIVLEGAVPDEESARRIVELASQVLGPDNVVDNYVIDPRADDPNLGNVRVDDNILFETGTAIIAPEFEPLLNQAFLLMSIRPSVTLHVVGHTDSIGDEAYNMTLSEQRADAVVRWLTDRGVDPTRLSAEGRGELEPVASNDTSEGRALNRRIQVFIDNLLTDS